MSTPEPAPTVSEQWAAMLDDLGLAVWRPHEVGGEVFLGGLPRDPAVAVGVSLLSGPPADARNAYDEPTLLLRVRGAAGDPAGAERRAQAVWDALHGLRARALPGGARLVRCFAATAGPIYVGRDDQGRHEWSVQMNTEIRRPSPTRR